MPFELLRLRRLGKRKHVSRSLSSSSAASRAASAVGGRGTGVDSGAGREGVRYAMEEMTEPRMIVLDPTQH